MKRDEVFKMLDVERVYQNEHYGTEFDKQNSIGDWIIYIEEYVNKAKKKFFGKRISGGADIDYEDHDSFNAEHAARLHKIHKEAILEQVKKIAALCVACMEHLMEEEEDTEH